MATAMAVGDIMSARAWTELNEQAAVNTFNFEVISRAGAGATDQQFANYFDSTYGSTYQTLLPPSATYAGTQVYFLARPAGGFLPSPVRSTAGAGPGSATLPPVPRNTAPILKYATAIRGPGGRGRVYLPFVSSDFLFTNGRPTTGFSVIVNSTASVLLTPVTIGSGGNTCQLVWVLVRKHKGLPATVTGQIVTAESADKFGQMHKRGDYGRANAVPF